MCVLQTLGKAVPMVQRKHACMSCLIFKRQKAHDPQTCRARGKISFFVRACVSLCGGRPHGAIGCRRAVIAGGAGHQSVARTHTQSTFSRRPGRHAEAAAAVHSRHGAHRRPPPQLEGELPSSYQVLACVLVVCVCVCVCARCSCGSLCRLQRVG